MYLHTPTSIAFPLVLPFGDPSSSAIFDTQHGKIERIFLRVLLVLTIWVVGLVDTVWYLWRMADIAQMCSRARMIPPVIPFDKTKVPKITALSLAHLCPSSSEI